MTRQFLVLLGVLLMMFFGCSPETAETCEPKAEVCDGYDNDCDGEWDEADDPNDLDLDCDGDGFVKLPRDDATGTDGSDCDPWDAAVGPDAPEIVDGLDNDCDGYCLDEEMCTGMVVMAPTGDPGCAMSVTGSWLSSIWPLLIAVMAIRRRSRWRLTVLPLLALGLVFGSCGRPPEIHEPQLMINANDHDGDGFGPPEDCDDENSSVRPGAIDVPNDGVDQDCDGTDATEADTDADTDSDADTDTDTDTDTPTTGETGILPPTGDTAPLPDTGHTGVPPIDPATTDDDGDGYCERNCSDGSLPGDCNDRLPAGRFFYPGRAEVCDGLDQDCDASIDEGLATQRYCTDADGDTYGDPATAVNACAPPPGAVLNCADCNDLEIVAHPGGLEVCSDPDVDEDCDSFFDDADPSVDAGTFEVFWSDIDSDGYPGSQTASAPACDPPPGFLPEDVDGDGVSDFDSYPTDPTRH